MTSCKFNYYFFYHWITKNGPYIFNRFLAKNLDVWNTADELGIHNVRPFFFPEAGLIGRTVELHCIGLSLKPARLTKNPGQFHNPIMVEGYM